MTIYRRRTPTHFTSHKDGVKDASTNTTTQTDLTHQDPKYCRPFMETPEMRDCLSRIISPTIMFHLLCFLSFLSSASLDKLGATQVLLDRHQIFASCQSFNKVFPFRPRTPQTASQTFRPLPFSKLQSRYLPEFHVFSGESFCNVGSVKGVQTRSATFLSPVDSTRHFTPQPTLLM